MNDDDSLSPLLKTWQHQSHETLDFNRGVWARLRAKPVAKESSVLGWLIDFPQVGARRAMPIAASLALLLSLAAGSGMAFAYESLTRNDRMAVAYARSIDPLQMASAHVHP